MAVLCTVLARAILASLAVSCSAGTFLKVRPHAEKNASFEVVRQTFATVLSMDVEEVHRLEEELMPMYVALPKDKHGALEPSVVRYALHRHFVNKYGWHIEGLQDPSIVPSPASPTSILKGKIPEYVQGLLQEHVDGHGWRLHELAVCAAVLSELIKHEVVQDLEFVYNLLEWPTSSVLDDKQVDQVIRLYLAQYLADESFQGTTPAEYLSEVAEIYESWKDLTSWAQDLRMSMEFAEASRTNPFIVKLSSFSRIAEIVQETLGHYTSFQNLECSAMADVILGMEYKSTGRVPLATFYHAGARRLGEFSEPKEYLQHSGALDDSDPTRLSVIIPNYIYGKNNCLASSGFYSVCCTNKCEGLLGHLERMLASSAAQPDRIVSIVSELSSDTVDAPRNLSVPLLARLREIASLHRGEVPLHGRLFSQWMHHAYPRECPFPHVDGTRNPLTPEAWEKASGIEYAISSGDLQMHILRHTHEIGEELPWMTAEELVGTKRRQRTTFLGRVVAIAVVVSIAIPLIRALNVALGSPESRTGKVHCV